LNAVTSPERPKKPKKPLRLVSSPVKEPESEGPPPGPAVILNSTVIGSADTSVDQQVIAPNRTSAVIDRSLLTPVIALVLRVELQKMTNFT
jgi:hypothetical protein